MHAEEDFLLGFEVFLGGRDGWLLDHGQGLGRFRFAHGEVDGEVTGSDERPGDGHFAGRIGSVDLAGGSMAEIPDEAIPASVGWDADLFRRDFRLRTIDW